MARVSRPDFLDLSNSLVKKQRFMFTPPNDHPPSSFADPHTELRQEGDGQLADQGQLEVSEYQTPMMRRNDGSEGEEEEDEDEEFVSFRSDVTMERCAPQGLSDRDLDAQRFQLAGHSGKDGLVKWKGVVLTPDEEYAEEAHLGLVRIVFLFVAKLTNNGFISILIVHF